MKYWIIGIALLTACAPGKEKTNLFTEGKPLGTVSKKLEEASGLIASVNNPGYLWSQNDSGNAAEIYLLNDKAEIVMTCVLDGIKNRDWEDITIGPGPEEGKNYLYVAEIGDNEARYQYKVLYRLEEPLLSEKKITINQIDTIAIQLSDRVRDTEAIMVDPLTKNFYILSKREEPIRLYEIAFPFAADTVPAVELTTLPFKNIVAAGISPDGTEVLLKDYGHIYYWKRNKGESISTLLQTPAINLTYKPEPQGESIAWKLDGSGFYTLSETVKKVDGELLFYQRQSGLPADQIPGKGN